MMPVQAMTQQVDFCVPFLVLVTFDYQQYTSDVLCQATRHARRVYVGGLPPTANEQVIICFILWIYHFVPLSQMVVTSLGISFKS